MIEIRFDKTKDEVALLIWFLVDHSVQTSILGLEADFKLTCNLYCHGNGTKLQV
jgi:hypothetical protein